VLFARQSHRPILFAPTDARGGARRLHARLDPDKALARLLKGSGWQARAAPGGAYLLVAVPVAEPRAPCPPAPHLHRCRDACPGADRRASDIVVVGTPGGRRRQQAALPSPPSTAPSIDQLGPPAPPRC
jgi:hypothetical protein